MKIVKDGTDSSEDFAALLQLKLQEELTIKDRGGVDGGVDVLLLPQTFKELKESIDNMTIICLGCAADGSMTSEYRKFLRSLRNASSEEKKVDKNRQFGVILLGGARCMNSAAATRSVVFGSGRKLTPALVTSGATIMLLPCYELNAELDDLEESAITIAKHVSKYCIRLRTKEEKSAAVQEKLSSEKSQMKVLSLLGGATETVFRLGCGYLLAGRSHECDWPPCILDDPKIPEVSRSLINADSSAYEIDSEVRSISFASEPAYILDQAIIEEIKPDLIIAQDQCRICAVSKTSLDTCEIIGAKQLILKPSSLEDVIGDVGRIAEAMNVPDRGDALMHLMRSRLDFVRAVSNPATPTDSPASPASTPNTPRPKVALLEWCSPLMGCGYWLGELVEIAGGVPLFYSKSTPTLSNIDVLIKAKPDVVIFALCGFDIPRATTELLGAFSAEDWQQLANAVGKVKGLASISRDSGVLETDGGDDAIYIVDGNALCNRSGPRIVESAEALSEAIGGYKRRGLFGHYGTDKLLSWKDALQQHQLKAAQIIDLSLSQSIDPASVSSPSDKSVKLVDIVKLGDPSAVSSVVAEQLKFLADGNIVGAFELNSPGNRARFCSAQRFEMILRSRPEFVALIGPFNTAAQAPRLVGDVNFLMQNQYATQLIEIRMPEAKGGAEGLEQRVQLQWTLSWVAENNTYMTERVGFAPTS